MTAHDLHRTARRTHWAILVGASASCAGNAEEDVGAAPDRADTTAVIEAVIEADTSLTGHVADTSRVPD